MRTTEGEKMTISLNELIKNSIEVTEGKEVIWPLDGNRVGNLKITKKTLAKFSGRKVFSTNNSTLGFIFENKFYAIPYSRSTMQVLRENEFEEEEFYVPFSNGDLPLDEQAKWQQLRNAARKSYEEDFAKDCIDYCESHGIHEISSIVLQQCILIPDSGIKFKHGNYEDTAYPLIMSTVAVDDSVTSKLGRYNTNNGKVVFVNCDGKTYVAKGHWVLNPLNHAGFLKGDFFVPFSNNEYIIDAYYRAKWAKCPKAV